MKAQAQQLSAALDAAQLTASADARAQTREVVKVIRDFIVKYSAPAGWLLRRLFPSRAAAIDRLTEVVDVLDDYLAGTA